MPYRVINIGKGKWALVNHKKHVNSQISPDFVYRYVLLVIHCKSNTLGEVAVSFHSFLFLSPHSFLSVWIKWPNKSSFRIFPAFFHLLKPEFSAFLTLFPESMISTPCSSLWPHYLLRPLSHLSKLDIMPFLPTISYRHPNLHRQLTAVLGPWPQWQ